MSNGDKWELSKWGDGDIRLVYWDWMAGKDVIIVLKNKKAYLVGWREAETLTEINLAEFLIEWLEGQQIRRKEE